MHVEAWLETYTGIIPEELLAAQSASGRTVMWEQILGDPAKNDGISAYVLEIGDAIAGFGACCEQRDKDLKDQGFEGEIAAIYVLQKHQREGIGRGLMSALAFDLDSRRFRGVALWVLRENAAARRFYERFAGEVVAEKTDCRGDTTLVEVAYGWTDIEALRRRVQK